jgi:hypothetical protein
MDEASIHPSHDTILPVIEKTLHFNVDKSVPVETSTVTNDKFRNHVLHSTNQVTTAVTRLHFIRQASRLNVE